MTSSRPMPRLFIGSSVEGLDAAYAVQENPDYDAEVTVWSQNLFLPSRAVLTELSRFCRQFDFAAFVFKADDVTTMRGKSTASVRDNVIFELGLFYGSLGLERCFFIVPREAEPMRLPTDLLGVSALTYRAGRSGGNLVAALGAACNGIRRAFREIAAVAPRPASGRPAFRAATLADFATKWDTAEMEASRAAIRLVAFDHYSDEAAGQRPHLERVFAFLESLSDAVLSGQVDETAARDRFGAAVASFWPIAASLLAPPNLTDEWWDPRPAMAVLCERWAPSGSDA